MADFSAIAELVAQSAVDRIGPQNLISVGVDPNEADGQITLDIALTEDTHASHMRVVDSMIDVRHEFFDDCAIEYFITGNAPVDPAVAYHLEISVV